jgi:hypothetical protein
MSSGKKKSTIVELYDFNQLLILWSNIYFGEDNPEAVKNKRALGLNACKHDTI